MAIPEGYEKLAAIGIAYKGEYVEGTAYKLLNAVYYSGSTFVALKDNPATPPAGDGANWQYLARGFVEGALAAVNATDTSGVLGTAGEEVNAQALMDAIADRVITKLVPTNKIVDNLLATETGTVLGAPQGRLLDNKITELNRRSPNVNYVSCARGDKFAKGVSFYSIRNGICFLTVEVTASAAVTNGDIVVTGLPKPQYHIYTSMPLANGNCYSVQINASSGNLVIYYPIYTAVSRIDATLTYPIHLASS